MMSRHGACTGLFVILSAGLAATGARSSPGEPTRISVPGVGLATDDATGSIATNPALFVFDPDPGLSLRYQQRLSDPLSAFHLSSSASGAGLGLFYRGGPSSDTQLWGLQSSLGLHLTEDLTLGSSFWWYLPDGSDSNFSSWDLGIGYRPLHFLGFGAVAQNIGSPAPEHGAVGIYGLGLALRPMGDSAILGVDQFFSDSSGVSEDDALPAHTTQLSLRVRPVRGLELRAYGNDHLEFGGGLRVAFGGGAVGAWGSHMSSDTPSLVGGLETTEPGERLVGLGRRIPSIHLHTEYPYEPRATLFSPPQESYLQLLRRLREATHDRAVDGVLLHLDRTPFSLAQIQELRDLIGELRAADRAVVVYLDEAADNRAYYLASAATEIYLHPAAELDLTGLSAETLYYRGALDLLGVQAEYQRRSEYKSATEPATRHSPSEPASEQLNELLDDLYGALVDGIAQGRSFEPSRVRELVDGGPYTAREAEDRDLVDGLLYPDQLEEELEEVYSEHYQLDEEYLVEPQHSGWQAPRRIAVVVVDGVISSGESAPPTILGGGTVGSETVVQALDQAREDPTVKAVVLRVDSPGGSAFASDDMWRAVRRLRDEDKPVVVSMGGVAASGGYYASADADVIYAQPSTITGSIGVYGGKVSLAGLYEKVGISSTIWARGRKSAMWSSSRPLDPVESEALERMIEETYQQFKSRVADGRDLDDDEVEQVARGRVWSGQRAQQLGLVDELGGLFDAVDRARAEAGIKPGARYELVTYESQRDTLGELPRRLIRAVTGPQLIAPELPRGFESLETWRALQHERIFAIMPYTVEIR